MSKREKIIGSVAVNTEGKRERLFGYAYVYDIEVESGLKLNGTLSSAKDGEIKIVGNRFFPRERLKRKELMPNGYGAKYEIIIREVEPDKERPSMYARLNEKNNKWQKRCTHCKRVSQAVTKEGLLNQFHSARSSKDGFSNECKRCKHGKKSEAIKYRTITRLRYPEKYKAGYLLNNAIKSGKIIKPKSCSVCGKSNTRIHGHHDDYSKPLDVIFVCHRCHSDIHNKERDLCKV